MEQVRHAGKNETTALTLKRKPEQLKRRLKAIYLSISVSGFVSVYRLANYPSICLYIYIYIIYIYIYIYIHTHTHVRLCLPTRAARRKAP